MGKIQILAPSVAERIAAGEVIERPSSVVKELVENSLDAGATEVAVHLRAGGKELIEVVDNGHGMSVDDLKISILRHATSKLRELEDLEKISTLGFRGEALPSVSAVSELRILTRPVERASESTAYELIAGSPHDPTPIIQDTTFGHFNGSPHGTRIQAAGLFSQIPARLKFLKSQAAEVSQVREWIERIALTHPHAGFKITSDERTILNLRPTDEVGRVREILAEKQDFPVLTATDDTGPIRVRFHWIQGMSLPQSKRLVQIINRRAVKDRVLQQAILSPFKQALLPGQYPAVAVFLELDPALLDVNVHPSKTEVRFLESGRIFRAVSRLGEALIAQEGAPAYAPGPLEESVGPLGEITSWTAKDSASETSFSGKSGFGSAPSRPSPLFLRSTPNPAPAHFQGELLGAQPSQPASDASPVDTAAPARAQAPVHSNQFSGILFNTYLLYDLGSELGLIDQHAAHERIRYEKLRKRVLTPGVEIPSQALLSPEVVNFDAEHRTLVESRLGWLQTLGFEAEIFGENALVFRALPPEWNRGAASLRLKNLVERVIEAASDDSISTGSNTLAIDETLFERLASEACHSAVRAGDRLLPEEASALIHDLFNCEHPWNCPHGRPTFVRIPRARFEEWFQRRV